MNIILEINGYKMIATLGEYHPRIKGNRYEQEEEEFYEIEDVILLVNTELNFLQIEEYVGSKDLFIDINNEVINIINEQYEKLWC